jgi:hypothetical protein
MSIDLKNDYSKIKNKLSAYQTVVENKKNEDIVNKSRDGDNQNQNTNKITQGVEELTENKRKSVKETKSQFEELIDILRYTIPKPDDNSPESAMVRIFLLALKNTKEKMLQIIFEESISAIGCSQEQEFEPGVPLYIKVSSIDLFNLLKEDADSGPMLFYYEPTETSNGTIPFAMNRALKNRLEEKGVPYSTDNGGDYIGTSKKNLFDFEYVTEDDQGNTGDFYKVTLSQRANSPKKITDFLIDYYRSIDILDFDIIIANIMNSLNGWSDISLGLDTNKKTDVSFFQKILNRILGLCFDETQQIDVSGTAKLGELDLIDESFFELTPMDLRNINDDIENMKQGVVEFIDCGNVKLPVDVEGTQEGLRKVKDEDSTERKVRAVEQMLDDTANNKDWKNLTLPGLNFNVSTKLDFIKKIPTSIIKSILTPKTLFGLYIAAKSNKVENIDNIETLKSFILTFKRYVVNLMSKISAIFVEELFTLIKENVNTLVRNIIKVILDEAIDKRGQIVSSIIDALFILGRGFIDFRKCKSVVDELLSLLNLALSFVNTSVPLPILAASDLLPGVSDTRAFANVVEEFQKSGLPTGDLPDGSPNLMLTGMLGMIKGMNLETTQNGKVNMFIPPLTITPAGLTVPAKAWGKQI